MSGDEVQVIVLDVDELLAGRGASKSSPPVVQVVEQDREEALEILEAALDERGVDEVIEALSRRQGEVLRVTRSRGMKCLFPPFCIPVGP